MDAWRSDLRSGIRALWRSPAHTVVALTTLALGLGASTLIVAVAGAVLDVGLPYPQGERLAIVWQTAPIAGYGELPLSAPDFLDLAAATPGTFDALAAFEYQDAVLTGDGPPRVLNAVAASAGLLPLLGATALEGRLLEDADGGNDVVVLSHGFWRRQFGGNPGAVGRLLTLDERPHAVVGVTAPGLDFPPPLTWQGRTFYRPPADLFLPLALDPRGDRGKHRLLVLGRLAPDVSPDDAEDALAPIVRGLAAAHPEVHPPGLSVRVADLGRQATAAAGLLLAAWGADLVGRRPPAEMLRLTGLELGAGSLAWGLGLAVLTVLVFAGLPALTATRGELARPLKELGRGLSAGPARGRLLRAAVVAEVALAATLLTTAAWMVRGLAELERLDPGFDAERLFTLDLPAGRPGAADDLLAALGARPEVEAAGAGSFVPLAGREEAGPFYAEGVPRPLGEVRLAASHQVTPGFFAALGVPLLAGRDLDSLDDAGAPRVVLVNRALATLAWPGEPPLGRRLTQDDPASPNAVWRTVVGVVDDVTDRRLDRPPGPALYVPLTQAEARRPSLVLRAAEAGPAFERAVAEAVWSVDPAVPIVLRPLAAPLVEALGRAAVPAVLLSLFAGAALVLAAGGIFAVVTLLTGERRHELAIRAALGARPGELASLVLRQGLGLAAQGAVLGMAAAFVLGRFLAGVLYGVGAADARILLGVPAVLFAVAAAAVLRPAVTAAAADAVVSLAAE